MDILIVNYEFPPIGGGGGHACYNIGKALVNQGHRVDVLTSRFGDQLEHETIEGMSIHRARSWRKGIHDCGIRGAFTFLCSGSLRLRRLLAQHRYDVVHYFFSLPTGVLSLYSQGVCGLPYVVSLRGSDVPGYDESSPKIKLFHSLLHRLNQRIWRRARSVVAVSHEFKRLAHKAAPGIPIEVIYNGVDPNQFTPSPRRGSEGAPRLICVSRLVDRKGIDCLLQALARVRSDIKLAIVGTGARESQLRAMTQELGLQDRVEFLGYRPNREIWRCYQEADIFVLPTLSEAFANVVLEAMSCGLPIVATATGGIPELVQDGVNGLLVPAGDTGSLAAAIERLARDPARRAEISQRNVERVAQHFTWTMAASQYQAIYARTSA